MPRTFNTSRKLRPTADTASRAFPGASIFTLCSGRGNRLSKRPRGRGFSWNGPARQSAHMYEHYVSGVHQLE